MGVNGHDDRTQCNEGGIFMNDFIFSYPTKVYFGKDALLNSWMRSAAMSCSPMAEAPSSETASMMK